MRVAVVTAAYGDFWREEELITRRVAGALACASEVDVLVADGAVASEERDGSLKVQRFPARPVDSLRRKLLLRVAGALESNELDFCSCVETTAGHSPYFPRLIQEELVRTAGGDSTTLNEYLRSSTYDVVLFAGYNSASTVFGLKAISDGRRIALLPLARKTPTLALEIFDPVFYRADQILVTSETERELVSRRLGGGSGSNKTSNIGFALQVSRLAAETEPVGSRDRAYLVVGGDLLNFPLGRVVRQAARVACDFEDVRVLFVGRGWQKLPRVGWIEIRRANSRQDVWRWTTRALAVLDPTHGRLVGREVLEALMYGTPIIVSEHGGAAREHAEMGGGGVWFRDYSDLRSSVEMLRSNSSRKTLGARGKEYADRAYGSSERFIERVTDAVLG